MAIASATDFPLSSNCYSKDLSLFRKKRKYYFTLTSPRNEFKHLNGNLKLKTQVKLNIILFLHYTTFTPIIYSIKSQVWIRKSLQMIEQKSIKGT